MKAHIPILRHLALLALVVTLPALARDQTVPPLINYQGRLVNTNNNPLPTGDYELRFSIWDAATGGTLVWGPQVLNGQNGPGLGPKVPVVQGWFNVMLGPVDIQNLLIVDAFNNSSRFVEVQVGTNPPLSPRQQIVSSPFTLWSQNSHSAEFASTASIATNVVNGMPAGTMLPFAGSGEPIGFLLCDGRAVSRVVYSQLYAAIGNTFGAGDGTSSFNLPNMRGRVPVGQDSAQDEFATKGQVGGAKSHVLSISEMPPHNHSQHMSQGISSGSSVYPAGLDSWRSDSSASILNTGGGQPHNNLQPYMVVSYIIKY